MNFTTFQNHGFSDLKLSDIPQLLSEYKNLANYLVRVCPLAPAPPLELDHRGQHHLVAIPRCLCG